MGSSSRFFFLMQSPPGTPGEPIVDEPETYLYDTFTDTNGTLLEDHTPEEGGPWVFAFGDPQIQSNQFAGGSETDYPQNLAIVDVGATDYRIIVDAVNTQFKAIPIRYVDINNFYQPLIFYDALHFWVRTAGDLTLLDEIPDGASNGIYKIDVIGDTCTILNLVTGVELVYSDMVQGADSTLIGIRTENATAAFDNILVQKIYEHDYSASDGYINDTFEDYTNVSLQDHVPVSGGPWNVVHGRILIDGNAVRGSGSVGAPNHVALVSNSHANFQATVELVGTQVKAFVFRAQDNTNYYTVVFFTNAIFIGSQVGATFNLLASVADAGPTGSATITVNGNTVSVDKGGNELSYDSLSLFASETDYGIRIEDDQVAFTSILVEPLP